MKNDSARVVESTPPVFRSEAYPRTYRIRRGTRIGAYVAAFALAAIGVAISIAIAFARRASSGDIPIALVIGTAFAVLGALAAESTRRWRVTLEADAIEEAGLLGKRRLERHHIAGWCARHLRGGPAFIVSRAEWSTHGAKRVTVSLMVDGDDAFDAWFNSIPNLNVSPKEQLREQVAADTSLGATREERLAKLTGAHRIARVAGLLTGAVTVWTIFVRSPLRPLLGVLFALPWMAVGLAATAPSLYKLDDDRDDARAGLYFVTLVPMFAVGLVAADAGIVEGMTPWVPIGLVAGGALVATILVVDRATRRWWKALLIATMISIFGVASTAAANCVFDGSTPEMYRARVLARHAGSRPKEGPRLRLTAWRDVSPQSVQVSRAVYDSVRVGDEACIEWRRGALRSPWWRVVVCDTR